jgi:hypothetical protein
MSEHTPEPWTIKRALRPVDGAYDYAIGAEIDDGGPYCIGEIVGRAAEDVWLPSEANAKRIVAAVNACVGIATDSLKPGAIKELVECLQKAREELRGYNIDICGEDYNNPRLNAALARFKESD